MFKMVSTMPILIKSPFVKNDWKILRSIMPCFWTWGIALRWSENTSGIGNACWNAIPNSPTGSSRKPNPSSSSPSARWRNGRKKKNPPKRFDFYFWIGYYVRMKVRKQMSNGKKGKNTWKKYSSKQTTTKRRIPPNFLLGSQRKCGNENPDHPEHWRNPPQARKGWILWSLQTHFGGSWWPDVRYQRRWKGNLFLFSGLLCRTCQVIQKPRYPFRGKRWHRGTCRGIHPEASHQGIHGQGIGRSRRKNLQMQGQAQICGRFNRRFAQHYFKEK